MPVALVAVAAAAAVSKGVQASKQATAAKHAADKQAQGVQAAQQIQQENANKAIQSIQQNYGDARGAITNEQANAGRLFDEQGNLISDAYQNAQNLYSPLHQLGSTATSTQADILGLNGPEAQRAAYANFNSSPGQSYLQSQGEGAILRNQARLGGGLGNQSNILRRLQEHRMGLAQQDFGNYYNNLGGIASRGDMATGAMSDLITNGSGALAQLLQNRIGYGQNASTNIANLFSGQGAAESNAYMGTGTQQAQLAQNLGEARAGFDLYRAKNADPYTQGILTGLNTYTSLGGKFGK